jgi:uncharacterized damage-inducible protein DinB
MDLLLRDLIDHQLWADAEHWRAIGEAVAAREDEAIRHRLHHIHQVQRFFIWVVGDRVEKPTSTTPDQFPSFDALESYARESHSAIVSFRDAVPEARLRESIAIPWFNDPPLTLTVVEALAQMASHSHYHRGQNATRLRQLGGTPPLTDLIVWYWKGRPPARL